MKEEMKACIVALALYDERWNCCSRLWDAGNAARIPIGEPVTSELIVQALAPVILGLDAHGISSYMVAKGLMQAVDPVAKEEAQERKEPPRATL